MTTEKLEGRFTTNIRDEDFVYAPRSETTFPEDVVNHFASEGFRLRWVRWMDGDGKIDTSNLRRTIQSDGFDFVRPEETEGITDGLGEIANIERYGSCICLGDLVLMKVSDHKAEARRKYYELETRKRQEATNELLRQNAIQNGSKSVTKTGKQAKFSAD